MSLILNLETSSKNCSVSLSSKGKLIDLIESEDENYRHSELLTTSIQDILSKNNLNVQEFKKRVNCIVFQTFDNNSSNFFKHAKI